MHIEAEVARVSVEVILTFQNLSVCLGFLSAGYIPADDVHQRLSAELRIVDSNIDKESRKIL